MDINQDSFISTNKKAKTAITMGWVVIGAIGVGFFLDFVTINLLYKIQNGIAVSMQEATGIDTLVVVVGWATLALILIEAIVLARWVHGSYSVLVQNGLVGLKYTPSKAGWSFFIPFVNLIRPLQVFQEIWLRSQEPEKIYEKYGFEQKTLVLNWWKLVLLSGGLGRLYFNFQPDTDAIAGLLNYTYMGMCLSLLDFTVFYLGIKVIKKISEFQNKTFHSQGDFLPPIT